MLGAAKSHCIERKRLEHGCGFENTGSVVWMEQHGEQPFRSVLELILLMDSALGGGQEERVS